MFKSLTFEFGGLPEMIRSPVLHRKSQTREHGLSLVSRPLVEILELFYQTFFALISALKSILGALGFYRDALIHCMIIYYYKIHPSIHPSPYSIVSNSFPVYHPPCYVKSPGFRNPECESCRQYRTQVYFPPFYRYLFLMISSYIRKGILAPLEPHTDTCKRQKYIYFRAHFIKSPEA